jgi:hypothetical protein
MAETEKMLRRVPALLVLTEIERTLLLSTVDLNVFQAGKVIISQVCLVSFLNCVIEYVSLLLCLTEFREQFVAHDAERRSSCNSENRKQKH